MSFKYLDIYTDLDGAMMQGEPFNCIYDADKTLMFYCIDDSEDDSYVAILDGNVLFDNGVIGLNQAGELVAISTLTKDIYVASVVWDSPYKKDDNISRGTAWMKGLNKFLKIINSNG